MEASTNKLIVPREEVGSPLSDMPFGSTLATCSLSLGKQTKRSLVVLDISKSEEFSFFGNVDDPELEMSLRSFIGRIGDNSSSTTGNVAKLVKDLTVEAATDLGEKAAWLAVRAGSGPVPYFDIPRWHQDGNFFTPAPEKGHYKFFATLKGAWTRFGTTDDPEEFKRLAKLYNKAYSEAYEAEEELDPVVEANLRNDIADVVKEVCPTKLKEAAYFLVGSADAVIHSEPETHGPRLCMSVLPGTIEQVRSLDMRWTEQKANRSGSN